VRLQPAGMLRVHDFGLDMRVLAYAVAITLASGILFGIAPALWSRHRDPADTLKDGGRSGMQSGRARRWAEALVIAEVALALVMTVGAGLLVRSFVAMRGVNPGFDPNLVWVGAVGLNHAYDTDEKMDVFMRDLQTRARGLPGVTNAALAMNVPLTGASWTSDFIGYGRPAGDYGTEVEHSLVSPGYFTTMRVPLLRGREFTDGDTPKTTPVILVNQTLARTYFPGQDPVGQRIAFDKVPTPKSTWYTIIGVVGDEHADDIATTPHIEVYEASTQNISNYMMLVVRTRQDPSAMTGSVRHMLMSMDPTLALTDVTTMDSLRDASLARARFLTLLMLVFGVIGLVLSVVGVYGVLAQVSRNRTREMGIRLALGARANQLRWLVVRQGLGLAGIGLVLGGVVALLSTRVMANLLFGVAPNDPLTLVSVALLLAATSVVAAWIPAQNASRADPSSALRAD